MSAEPKPEKPRTAPARMAAPTAAANDAERTSRVVPPAWITARDDPWPAASRATLGIASGGTRLAAGHRTAAAGGAARGGADAARALDAVGMAVEPAALGVRGEAVGEVDVHQVLHVIHGRLRRAPPHRADGATCGADPLTPRAEALRVRRALDLYMPWRLYSLVMDAADGRLEEHQGRWRLRFERRLAHPPERVWRAITEPDDLRAWFPFDIEGDRAAGA